MKEKKIFKLHDTLISHGFVAEANEIIKLAKASLVEDILLEAEENMNKASNERWKTKLSKTQPVSTGEIKSVLLSLGCEEINRRGGESHEKFSTETIKQVKSLVENPVSAALIPEESINYFKHTFGQVDGKFDFFVVQRGSSSFVPPTSVISDFWKFVKCLAAAKIILEKYSAASSSRAKSGSEEYKNQLFQVLLDRKNLLAERMKWLNTSPQNEDEILSLMAEEEDLDNQIQEFWST